MLRIVERQNIGVARKESIDPAALLLAQEILESVRDEGEAAVRRYAEQFGDLTSEGQLFYSKEELQAALDSLADADRLVLERTALRIETFAKAQLESLREFSLSSKTGKMGQRITALDSAACYAPAGRYPLPSSVLMTACTARVAGVATVTVISPKPSVEILAAAAIAGADQLLAVGGAQGIAAAAYGLQDLRQADVIVGPGNKFVTAAKKLLAGEIRIDMLAGPSELLILADSSANPAFIAADLLAQAEHDEDAVPMLICTEATMVTKVLGELEEQLQTLSTAAVAKEALERNGFAFIAESMEEAIAVCNTIAPEHLQVMTMDPDSIASRLKNYGALFLGEQTAEVFGDYGAGPNHVLPTEGTARTTSGLSVLNFLRIHTWLQISEDGNCAELIDDAVALARMEGLEAHARAAEQRRFIS